MGYNTYNVNSRSLRATTDGYHVKSAKELFKQRSVHDSLSCNGVNFRECFDSEAHPNTIAGIIGLDVTGSMGRIPHNLIRDGLPHIMGTIIEKGTPDVAICFVAVGDHKSDKGILQVGQFESGDEELDQHLQNTWIEENGGGNGGESYPLVWYFAGNHTKTDCFTKRGQKGILITIGDEDFHNSYEKDDITRLFGNSTKIEGRVTAQTLLEQAQKMYHVYHLGLPSSHNMSAWRHLLKENFIEVNEDEIPNKIAEIFLQHSRQQHTPIESVHSTHHEDSGSGQASRDEDVVFVK